MLLLLLDVGGAIAQSAPNREGALGTAGAAPSAGSGMFELNYTGGLFGYYRIEPDDPGSLKPR